jgi:hypothetical protein
MTRLDSKLDRCFLRSPEVVLRSAADLEMSDGAGFLKIMAAKSVPSDE